MAIKTDYTARSGVVPIPGIINATTAGYTMTLADHGKIITNKGQSGSVTVTAPTGAFAGFTVHLMCAAAQAFVFDPKPDTAALIIKGAIQSAGKTLSVTDEGDFVTLVFDGTDWLATSSISGADADITIET